jgi:hypothetical protein
MTNVQAQMPNGEKRCFGIQAFGHISLAIWLLRSGIQDLEWGDCRRFLSVVAFLTANASASLLK